MGLVMYPLFFYSEQLVGISKCDNISFVEEFMLSHMIAFCSSFYAFASWCLENIFSSVINIGVLEVD